MLQLTFPFPSGVFARVPVAPPSLSPLISSLDRRPDTAMAVINPLTDGQWDAEVSSHPHANIFHRKSWARVLSRTYGCELSYLRFTQGGTLQALVPLMELRSRFTGFRGISLPYSDFCHPLLFPGADAGEIFSKVAAFARERRWSYLELRGGGLQPADAMPALSFHAHQLDLRAGAEAVHRGFRSSVRQALRKAAGSPLEAEVSADAAAMRTFFQLHRETRQRHGLPPQPFSFFRIIQEEIMESGQGFVVTVRCQKRPVASMVFFQGSPCGIYKFGASDKRYQGMRANNLAMWTGIQELIRTGQETLHFGRSSLPNDGLRRFKLSWGATETALHYYRLDPARGTWGTANDHTVGLHTHLFRFLPAALNQLAGSLIYPHLD